MEKIITKNTITTTMMNNMVMNISTIMSNMETNIHHMDRDKYTNQSS